MARKKQECDHKWVKNGHAHGKQRYICKKCSKTCGELDIDAQKFLYNLNLKLINSFPSHEIIVSSDSKIKKLSKDSKFLNEFYYEDDCHQYTVIKNRVTVSEFIKILKKVNRLYRPMIVYAEELNPSALNHRDTQLFVYEVY